jgi:hypothetical protein
MRSSIFGIYHSGGVFHPSATYIGQFGKLTDRTEGGTPVPELVEGALPKPYIYSVAHASGSESSVLFPWLLLLLLPLLPSVKLCG